jgi:hypothetical protein
VSVRDARLVTRVAAAAGAALAVALAAASCAAPDAPELAPPEPIAEAEAFMHANHAGAPPWPHVLTCYGGCEAPHYDASACNHHTSCGPIANGHWWYATERMAFHCGAKLKLERGNKCVVVDVEDNGPADWVESNADAKCGTPYIIDTSPLVADYFGGGCGWGECFLVQVSPVPDSTPTGPDGCVTCTCKPGETQTEGCGNCGSRHRACGGDCHWGGWSGCEGEGPCAKGTVQTEACCDCGQKQRACDDACQWQAWSACAGPDPDEGKDACATGEQGRCAAGHVRCVQGCRACVRDLEPRAETCDDVDEDCDGAIDDDAPETVGDPAPRFAARLDDESRPMVLAPGEAAMAWAVFTNVGRDAWPAGQVWLTSAAAAAGAASPLRGEAWPAWDVAAVVADDVPPGAQARVAYEVRAPLDPRDLAHDELVLRAPDGAAMRCPSPGITLDLSVEPSLARATATEPAIAAASGCAVAAGGRGAAAPFAATLALAAIALRRRRPRARE